MVSQQDSDLPDNLFPPDNVERVPPTPSLPVDVGEHGHHDELGKVFIHRVTPLFIDDGILVVLYDGDEVREIKDTADHFRSVLT
jgi:hypothetical protein